MHAARDLARLRSQLRLRSHVLALGLGLLLAAGTATAQSGYSESEPSAFGRSGGYLSLGVGGATESFNFDTGGLDIGTAFLLSGRIGARANRFVAIEAAFDYSLTGFKASDTIPNVGAAEIEAKALVGTGNIKLYPIDSRIQPFVMGGGGFMYATLDCKLNGVGVTCPLPSSKTTFAGRVGGGLDVYLTRNLALTGEIAYVIPTGDLEDLNFLTFGGQLMFRF
jgi:opacity protein-like surface antigen